MGKPQGGKAWLDSSFSDMGKVNEEENRREHGEDDAEREVRHLDRLRSMRAGSDEVLEDKVTADQRSQRRAERVESLSQVEPARGGPFRSQDGDVRISRDLQHGEAETYHEQSCQEEWVRECRRRRPEERTARSRNHESDDDAILTTDSRDGIADCDRDGKVKQRADE